MMSIEEAHEQLNILGKSAELANYQNEPPQMPSNSPGKRGYLSLHFSHAQTRSIMDGMTHRSPFLVQRPLYWDEEMPYMPCIFLITTSGCVLQGDRLALDIHLAPNACAHLTTQSATKIHTMTHNYAAQIQHFTLEENSYLEVLPEAIIPHNHSRFINTTEIKIHPSATLLYSEILMSGRKYHSHDGGFKFDLYSSRTKAQTLEGQELFSEYYILEPQRYPLKGVGIMRDFTVYGNVTLLTPERHHDAILSRLPPHYDHEAGIAYGISRLPNNSGLIFKVLGNEAYQVKAAILNFWQETRQEVIGATVPTPFIWK